MKSLINQILSRNRFLAGVKPPNDEGGELDLVKRLLRHIPQPGESREVEVHLEVKGESAPVPEEVEKDDAEDSPSVEAPEEKPEPKVEVKVVERIVQAPPVEPAPQPAYRFKVMRDSDGLIESVIASPIDAEEAKRSSATSLAEAML